MATTKVTTDVIDMSGNAGGLTWVKGTTAQRTTTTIGDLREDTDTKRTQVYTDQSGTAEWRNLKEEGVSISVDFLVVAGGGGSWRRRRRRYIWRRRRCWRIKNFFQYIRRWTKCRKCLTN